MSYFEGQNDRDCTIHSINNAFGEAVVTKEDVLRHIEDVVDIQKRKLDKMGLDEYDIGKKELAMRSRYSSGESFFAADIVWDTAKTQGKYYDVIPISCMTSPFLQLDVLLLPEIKERPVVVLGNVGKGQNHAIAVRGGMIYDSEFADKGPRSLTEANMKKSLKEIYGAYVFAESRSAVANIKRILRAITTIKSKN